MNRNNTLKLCICDESDLLTANTTHTIALNDFFPESFRVVIRKISETVRGRRRLLDFTRKTIPRLLENIRKLTSFFNALITWWQYCTYVALKHVRRDTRNSYKYTHIWLYKHCSKMYFLTVILMKLTFYWQDMEKKKTILKKKKANQIAT